MRGPSWYGERSELVLGGPSWYKEVRASTGRSELVLGGASLHQGARSGGFFALRARCARFLAYRGRAFTREYPQSPTPSTIHPMGEGVDPQNRPCGAARGGPSPPLALPPHDSGLTAFLPPLLLPFL